MTGWVKLYRSLAEHELWLAEPFTYGQAWADLVMCTNHAPGSFMVKRQRVALERGQIGWSEITMTQRWKWSRGKVRRFLKRLESDGMIKQQTGHLTSVITICNYNEYQGEPKQDGTSDSTADGTPDGHLTVHETVHKQECKELKERKELKPTLDQTNLDRLFNFFYSAYPKKVDKQKAVQKFGVIFRGKEPAQADELLDLIIINIEQRIAAGGWDLLNKQYIPSPAKYLLNKLWEDEIIGAPNGQHRQTSSQPGQIDHQDTTWGDEFLDQPADHSTGQQDLRPAESDLPRLEASYPHNRR
jgi:hypothetical protein